MKKFSLSYSSKQMETEYSTLKQHTNVQDVQMTFYFLIFFLMLPGIPALISEHYLEAAISLATGATFIMIYCTKLIPKKYTQFLGGIIVCLFNFGVYYLPYSSFYKLPKDVLFFQGFSYGGLNVALLSRFSQLKQKVIFLIFSYAVRFIVIASFDMKALRWYAIVRHVYIDIFVFYINYLNEKKDRKVFRSFYEYREELIKFKELLAEYLPQSLTVLSTSSDSHLFCNKAFTNLFDNSAEAKTLSEAGFLQSSMTNRSWKPNLNSLKVDKDTLRIIGASSTPTFLKPSSDIVYLKDVINDIILDKSSEKKAFSVSAFYSVQDVEKSFDVILTKVQWDGEKAIAVILNDITYQTDLIALKISDVNKDKIMATVSHELRTPLNGIIGILEMIKVMVNDAKVLEYLGLCKDNAHLLLNLVNSLLDLHQVRQGKLRLNSTRIEVRQVFQDIIRLFSFQCHHKGIDLRLRVDKNVESHINTDENRLKQILINLIGNALKFTSVGGIAVQVRQDRVDADCLEISVSDTGIGIKGEDKGKLFQMYEKLEHGRSVNKNGVGLGLTISNTLASLLGKNTEDKAFEVVSEVNRGSKFIFKILKDLKDLSAEIAEIAEIAETEMKAKFNMEDGDQDSPPAREHSQIILSSSPVQRKIESHILYKRFTVDRFDRLESEEESKNLCHFLRDDEVDDIAAEFQLGKKKSRKLTLGTRKWKTVEESLAKPPIKNETKNLSILVVDDNPFNLLVAENIVKNLGYTFMMAKGGHEAIEMVKLKALKREQFCMILMDCQMPGIDGFETTKLLRELMETKEVPLTPIVALTAVNGEDEIKKCYESGMVECLLKPLFHDALLEVLNKYKQ